MLQRALARRLAGPCRVFSSAAAATNHAAVSDALGKCWARVLGANATITSLNLESNAISTGCDPHATSAPAWCSAAADR